MLISITEKCRMGCPHCMDCATPEGSDMDMKTFQEAVRFFNMYGSLVMLITGGEPTENPQCVDMLDYALRNTNELTQILLATNAMNIAGNKKLQDDLSHLIDRYNDRLQIQITSVDGLYPIKVDFNEPFFSQRNVTICTQIESMYPQGRAVENGFPAKAKVSKCFNIRSLIRSFGSLKIASVTLATRFHFCTPRVNWNGDLKLGESRLCPTVCTIFDNEETINQKIKDFRCDKCGLIGKLDYKYRAAVGEV